MKIKMVMIAVFAAALYAGAYHIASADNYPIQPGYDYDAHVTSSENVVLRVRKDSAGTIAKGKPVCITGYNASGWYEVEAADADNSSLGPVIGILKSTTSPSVTADCVVHGVVSNIDTSSYSVGDILYLSATVGTLTTTPPTGTGARLKGCAVVLVSNATSGVLHVTGGQFDENPTLAKTFGSSTTITLDNGDMTVGNNLTVTGNAAVTGTSTHTGKIWAGPAKFVNSSTTSNQWVGGTLDVNGATDLGGNVSATGGQSTIGNATGPVHTKSLTFNNESGILMTNQNGTRMRCYVNNSTFTCEPR